MPARTVELKSLASRTLVSPGNDPWRVAPTDAARSVMTDFRERSAISVSEDSTIDTALLHMKHTGVRSAFVLDREGQQVLGLVTAYDIQGEKPLRFLQSVGWMERGASRGHVLAREIMEPIEQWQVVDIAEVERADVTMILDAFRRCGRTHIAVVERRDDGGEHLRGLFSYAKITRLLSNP
jgi:CBS domain containing-hemolysin-like protein